MIWAGREVNCGEELGTTWWRREAEEQKEHLRMKKKMREGESTSECEDKILHGKMEKAVSRADGGFDT